MNLSKVYKPTRLFLFPALIPLASILPWLLSLVGFLAGISHFIIKKKKRWALGLCVVFVFTCLVWRFYWHTNASAEFIFKEEDWQKILRISERKEWITPLESSALSNLVISQGLVFVASMDGKVFAYSQNTGDLIWTVQKQKPILSLAASSNYLVIGEGLHSDNTSSLTAVKLPMGPIVWNKQFSGHQEMPVFIDERAQKIWAGFGQEGLACLDLLTGRVLWNEKLGHIDSTPFVITNVHYNSDNPEKLVLVASQSDIKNPQSAFSVLNAETGKKLWDIKLPGQPWGSPLVVEKHPDLILLTTSIGQITTSKNNNDKGWSHLISLKEKKLLWSKELKDFILPTSISYNDQNVFHVLRNGTVLSLNAISGIVNWEKDLGSMILAPPAFSKEQNLLAVLTVDGNLNLIDSGSGKIKKVIPAEINSTSGGVFDKDIFFMATPAALSALKL